MPGVGILEPACGLGEVMETCDKLQRWFCGLAKLMSSSEAMQDRACLKGQHAVHCDCGGPFSLQNMMVPSALSKLCGVWSSWPQHAL